MTPSNHRHQYGLAAADVAPLYLFSKLSATVHSRRMLALLSVSLFQVLIQRPLFAASKLVPCRVLLLRQSEARYALGSFV